MAESLETTNFRKNFLCKEWVRNQHRISTNPELVDVDKLKDAFGTPELYWTREMPREVVVECLSNSLCFAIHEVNPEGESTEMVGFARCVTDCISFLYLTDVYVWPGNQGKGLGKWLIECVQEVIQEMPHLRRSILFTSDWERSVPFYEKLMDMTVVRVGTKSDREGPALLQRAGPGLPEALR